MSLNDEFLGKLTKSFQTYLKSSPRSNEKLKVIHPFIADSIKNKFNNPQLKFYSLRKDGESKEIEIEGRYMYKAVDISICNELNKVLSAVGFKFIMSNYKQNSNNYFENMLGETANIRCSSIPYFQILVLPVKLPYFDKHGKITHWEETNEHNIRKYQVLSTDNYQDFFHTPILTLLYFVNLEDEDDSVVDRKSYKKYYKNKKLSVNDTFNIPDNFSNGVVVNDFELFVDKLYHFFKYKYNL